MAVIPDWSQFRLIFGIGGSTSKQLLGKTTSLFTFIPGPPPRLTQAAGSFLVDRHAIDMFCDITGSALNNGRYQLANVTALQLTFVDGSALQAEVVTATATSLYRGPDQVEIFPSELHPATNLVRSSGFIGGFTGVAKPYIGTTMSISCNGGAADAVYGVADYHWYLSQRTDDPAKQFLTCVEKPASGGLTYSGTVQITHTAHAYSELGISGVPSMDGVKALFDMCHLYAKRVTNGAIQWVDIYREMMRP